MTTDQRVALVTGAAHRLGRAIANGLAEQGYRLMLHYNRAEDAAREARDELTSMGIEIELHCADLTDPAQIGELFDHTDARFKRLDVLVNSAAIMQRVDFDQVGLPEWTSTIDLNLRAPFFCIQRAARMMKRKNGGVVVNISDIAGLQAWPRFPVHSISKAGVEMLTRVAAAEYGPEIRVNGVAPGPVLKPEGMSDGRWKQIGSELPLGRAGTPRAVVEAVLFLIKNEAINGQTLVVDGGYKLG